MITVAIFTYKRTTRLNQCLQTFDSTNIDEILIFNDDEMRNLLLNDIEINNPSIKIFNPSDWGFTGRKFRKPIYLNRAVEIAKNDKILFSESHSRYLLSVEKNNLDDLKTILEKNYTSFEIIGNFGGNSILFSNDSKPVIDLMVDKTQKTWLNSLEGLIMHA